MKMPLYKVKVDREDWGGSIFVEAYGVNQKTALATVVLAFTKETRQKTWTDSWVANGKEVKLLRGGEKLVLTPTVMIV